MLHSADKNLEDKTPQHGTPHNWEEEYCIYKKIRYRILMDIELNSGKVYYYVEIFESRVQLEKSIVTGKFYLLITKN